MSKNNNKDKDNKNKKEEEKENQDTNQQDTRAISRVKSVKKDSQEKVTCAGCQIEFNRDSIGIKCQGNDFMCSQNDCAFNFIKTWLEEPKYPIMCFCGNEIHQNTLEMCIDSEQLEQYLNVCAVYCKQEGEQIVKCSQCGYFEYGPEETQQLFFYCKKQKCFNVTCMVCHKKLKKLDNFYDEQGTDYKEYEKHIMVCDPFRKIKKEWDQIIEDGQQQACPGCGLKGVKNNACNKITCYKCNTGWCYYCGLDEKTFDKEDPKLPYSHYIDWQNNYNKRCPLYLEDLHDFNNIFPESNNECLTLIHRNKTVRLLRKFVEKIGQVEYLKLCQQFPQCGDSSGYTFEQIMNQDLSFTKL